MFIYCLSNLPHESIHHMTSSQQPWPPAGGILFVSSTPPPSFWQFKTNLFSRYPSSEELLLTWNHNSLSLLISLYSGELQITKGHGPETSTQSLTCFPIFFISISNVQHLLYLLFQLQMLCSCSQLAAQINMTDLLELVSPLSSPH